MTTMNDQLSPDQERFMLWLEGQDVMGHSIDAADVPSEWLAERSNTRALSHLLRDSLPGSLDAAAAGINSGVLARIAQG
jgi:hypothetical protein